MAVPKSIDDGKLRQPHQHGPVVYRFPFAELGDETTFEAVETWRCDWRDFRPSQSMTLKKFDLGNAYLVEGEDNRHDDGGVCEWQRVYSSVPNTRVEGSTITYSIQFLSTSVSYNFDSPPASPEISELPLLMSCDIVTEYGLSKFTPRIKGRAAVVFNTVFRISQVNPDIVDNGTANSNVGNARVSNASAFGSAESIVAEDSECGIYKGKIYYRRTPFITSPLINGA